MPSEWAFKCPSCFHQTYETTICGSSGQGILLVAYIDDILIADSKEALELALTETITMVTDLGFTINYNKSQLVPSQEVCFLGFLINSVTMEVCMTPTKSAKLIQACQSLLGKESPTVLTPEH